MRRLRLLLLAAALAVLVAAAVTVPLPVFLERPGEVLSLGDNVRVELPGEDRAEINGDFLLTVVTLERATAVGVLGGLLDDNAQLVPVHRVTGGVDQETYFERQVALFDATTDVAAAVGLAAAGLHPHPQGVSGEGALVVQVVRGAPADGTLEPGDVITAVDGEPVADADELVDAVDAATRSVTLTYVRDDTERRAEVELGSVAGRDEPGLGVGVETAPATPQLPVPVEVASGRIGGPSAGLMIALTVFDKAADADLASGRRIAGTGGLAPRGGVEDVGGVAQKVLAAARADVDVFVVPDEQLDTARGARPAQADLELVGVGSFDEAVDALRDGAAARQLDRDRGVSAETVWASRQPAASRFRGRQAGYRVRRPPSRRAGVPRSGCRADAIADAGRTPAPAA